MNNKFNKFAVLAAFGAQFMAGCVVPGAYTYDTYGTTTYTTGAAVYAEPAYPAGVTYVETTRVEPVLVTMGHHRKPAPRLHETHRPPATMPKAHGKPAAPKAHAAPRNQAPKMNATPRTQAPKAHGATPKATPKPTHAAAPKAHGRQPKANNAHKPKGRL